MLVKNYRDMLQKALWMNKGNANTAKVTSALLDMLKDEEAMNAIEKKVGDYDWFIGDELLEVVSILEANKNPRSKGYLIKWQREVLGYNAIDK